MKIESGTNREKPAQSLTNEKTTNGDPRLLNDEATNRVMDLSLANKIKMYVVTD